MSTMRRAKILYVLYSLYAGGLENGIINLINRSSEEFEHIVCCLMKRGVLANRLTPQVKIIEMDMKEGNDYFMPLRIAGMLKAEQIDIVRAFTEDPLFYSFFPATLTKRPLIYYVGGKSGGQKKRRLILERLFAKRASAVVVPSEALRKHIAWQVGVKEEKIRVISNGVDVDRFEKPVDVMRTKEELCIPQKDLVIGAVGRLVKQKDYSTFLRIAKALLQRRNDTTFVIVGDGELRLDLECTAKELGIFERVKFLGVRNDLDRIYKVMDIFMHTSRWEGMSNATLEAMACRKPVLVTDVEGMSQIIRSGVNGFVFEPGDVDGFVSIILQLSQEKIKELGDRAFLTVRDHFSIEEMVRRYEDLYREFLQ